MKAHVVVDLGFGDAGKGTLVDWLVRRERADLVVRFNGGAQAGHNVVTDDGRHHTFAQFGAGTFVPGCRTHLAEAFVLHPHALVVEEAWLRRAGVEDGFERLSVAPEALVTTPFHQALGRLRELAREHPHGSCGVGVGETVWAAERHARAAGEGAVLRARDLASTGLRPRVEAVRARLLEDARGVEGGGTRAHDERRLLEDPGVTERWLRAIEPVLARARAPSHSHSLLCDAPHFDRVVLEGAQGILLDEHWGFHPHTTWSATTTKHADAWARRVGLAGDEICRLGVVRTYSTRHGPGPLPSETSELAHLEEPHNDDGGFQGRFRRGWPDPELWRYALCATGGLDAVAVTHLDALSRHEWRAVKPSSARVRILSSPPESTDFAGRSELTRAMSALPIELEPAPRCERDFMAWAEEQLGTPVAIGSHGPTAGAKFWRR